MNIFRSRGTACVFAAYAVVATLCLSLWPRGAAVAGSVSAAAANNPEDEAVVEGDLDAAMLASSVYSLTQKIRETYHDPSKATTDALLEGAFSGMLSALDPHSAYFSPQEYKEFQLRFSGGLVGIGVEIGMDETLRAVKVQAVLKGTPAERSGLRPDDYPVGIKEKGAPRVTSLRGMPLEKVASLVRGLPGTDVEITIYRPSEKKQIVFPLLREKIEISSVEGFLLPGGIGLINLTSFVETTCEDAEKEIAKIEKTYGRTLRGMIVNARNNPGGSLATAVCISDLFLDATAPEKTIVSMRGVTHEHSASWEVETEKRGDILHGASLVVLVNKHSASASEVFAGAMQDNRRGVIAGETTFGKGTVQTLFPLDNGGAVKITVARYYTPKGRAIQAKGVVPDVALRDYAPKDADPSAAPDMSEADLFGHLPGEPDASSEASLDMEQTEALEKLAKEDPALFQAYGLVQGIVVARKH